MTIIPAQSGAKTYQLFVVLEDENLERIKQHDAAQVRPNLGNIWDALTLTDVWLCYISKEEQPEFRQLIEERNFAAVIKLLMAGWKHRPELGDSDTIQMPRNQ